jgi:hypothetical protein
MRANIDECIADKPVVAVRGASHYHWLTIHEFPPTVDGPKPLVDLLNRPTVMRCVAYHIPPARWS